MKKLVEKVAVKAAEKKATDRLLEIHTNLLKLTAEPERFLLDQPEKYNDIQKMLQSIYAITVESDGDFLDNPEILPELVVEEMEEEQVWQQLELRNSAILNKMIANTANLMALREEKLEVHLKENDQDGEEMMEEEEGDDELSGEEEGDEETEDDALLEENEDVFSPAPKRKRKLQRTSEVDDKFFKLDEMEEFLEAEEAKEARKVKGKIPVDDDGINYFADDLGDEEENDTDEEETNPNYKDFFDEEEDDDENEAKLINKEKKNNLKGHFTEIEDGEDIDEEINNDEDKELDDNESSYDENEENAAKSNKENLDNGLGADSSSDEVEDVVPKSSFEMKQSRLEQRIRDYEEEVLGEKPWQLKGEIQATNRPQNSLLEEVLEFESTVRPAPIITEETTRRLEDIIKQRIKDQAWDDVVRKVKPTNTPQEYRKQLVLDQEKSKESLAHIYEKEYQRELEKLNPNRDDNEIDEPKEHKQIRSLMRDLFVKLDALSNFHFTPKPVAPEPKIITNTPAVAMEEVAPVAVSDAKLLAPEEVFRGPKHELIGKSERTKTDKNRALRNKKSKQRAIHHALEAKDLQKQKMGIPLTKKEESAKLMKKLTKQRNVEKITTSNDQGALKSSKAFFSKLQDQSTVGNTIKPNKKKPDAKSLSAKKLKL